MFVGLSTIVKLLNTVLYRRCAARHRHVFAMITIVSIPAGVSAVSYRCLVADTLYVVQPDRSVPWPIPVSNHRSFVSEINNNRVDKSAVLLADPLASIVNL